MTVAALQAPRAERSPWFVSWFDSIHYHNLYAYRDDSEAAGFIDELIQYLRPVNGSSMLDVGCGAGRHSIYLASKGFLVTGIDLSAGSIRKARRSERPGLHFVQHDMRVPFGKNEVDYVFNFFTSFGYFDNLADHLSVIRNMADSLKTGGRLVLDYLNVAYAEVCAMPEETRIIDGHVYRITRWSDDRHFFKRIVIEDSAGIDRREYLERVAKFNVGDFRAMFEACGLSIDAVYGDYRLRSYDPVASPRMILIARRTDEHRTE